MLLSSNFVFAQQMPNINVLQTTPNNPNNTVQVEKLINQGKIYNFTYAGGTNIDEIDCPITKSLFTGVIESPKNSQGISVVKINPTEGNVTFDPNVALKTISVLQK